MSIRIKFILFSLIIAIQVASAQEDVVRQGMETILKHSRIQSLVVDGENHKYIGTDDGLYRIRAVSAKIDTLITGKSILALCWYHRTGLWAGLENGKVLHLDSGNEIELDDPQARITSLSTGGNQIWIGTENGAYTASTSSFHISEHFTPQNSKLPSAKVNTLYYGPYNVIWVGTDDGILRVDGDKWNVYESGQTIEAITQTTEGIWIASTEKLWLIYQKNRWADADASTGLKKGSIRAVSSDNEGNIYIASEILVRFNPYEDRIDSLSIDPAMLGANHFAMGWDKNEQLWLASDAEGLVNVRIFDETVDVLSAVMLVKEQPKCASDSTGALEIEVAGGVPPYTYVWNIPNYVGSELRNLPEGEYAVSITDAEGRNYLLNAMIEAPEPIQTSIVQTNAPSSKGLSNGEAEIEITGGVQPYEIIWDSGDEGAKAVGLSSGVHIYTVFDKNGCTVDGEVTIEEGKLFAELDIRKIKEGQALRIEQLYFKADSSNIEVGSFEILDEIYAFLRQNEKIVIEIGGHTNNIPPDEYCDRLSTDRAESVAKYLYGKGIPESRIAYKGYGKREPVATNSTADGRRKNQRVELRILSLGSPDSDE